MYISYALGIIRTMIIYADDREYADGILPDRNPWMFSQTSAADSNLTELMQRLFSRVTVYKKLNVQLGKWAEVFVVKHASSSHFDHLVEMSQKDIELPDRTLCLAGSGKKFRGQRKRPWAAIEGNIHLAVYLSPRRIIKKFHTGFPVLAAVSLIDALDASDSLEKRANIKWVNDILIDGAKIAGFLVHTQSLEDTVLTAVLGIGLNVEKTPTIEIDPFVPKVACLRDFGRDTSSIHLKNVLFKLLQSLDRNYDLLLSDRYDVLLKSYRERSLVIGQHVTVISDTPGKEFREIASGKVVGIGENLELILKGRSKPVTSGRLILT